MIFKFRASPDRAAGQIVTVFVGEKGYTFQNVGSLRLTDHEWENLRVILNRGAGLDEYGNLDTQTYPAKSKEA